MSNIQPVVLALIQKGNKYLLTKRVEFDPEDEFHNVWQIPGGGLEFGEAVEDGLRREVREELGIEVTNLRLVPFIPHRVYEDKWHGIFLMYWCDMKNPNDPVIINHEASEYGWFTVEEVKDMQCLPNMYTIMKKVEEYGARERT